MFKEIALPRPWFMKRTSRADEKVTGANTRKAHKMTTMAAGIPQKWNSELGVVIVGTVFYGLAAVVQTGDPRKSLLLF